MTRKSPGEEGECDQCLRCYRARLQRRTSTLNCLDEPAVSRSSCRQMLMMPMGYVLNKGLSAQLNHEHILISRMDLTCSRFCSLLSWTICKSWCLLPFPGRGRVHNSMSAVESREEKEIFLDTKFKSSGLSNVMHVMLDVFNKLHLHFHRIAITTRLREVER